MRGTRGKSEAPKYSRISQLREWVGIGLGIMGTVIAILGYHEAVRSRERSARVEAYVYLDNAWDLMGGRPGAAMIINPIKDPVRLEEARRAIERAFVLDPDSGKGFRVRGAYLRAAGKLQEAIGSLEKALVLDPDDHRSHAALGILCIDAGNYSRARAELSEATRLEPADYNNFVNLGVLSTKQDRLDEAIGYFNQAIQISPEYQAVFNLKGAVLRRLGREAEALMCFGQSAKLRRDYSSADKLEASSRDSWAKRHHKAPVPDCRHSR